ncbi:unnamed protein product [Coffea canephora]|uniref:Uncharacterized protein n=1 Tax=Coffea canephora TaxID=49390 RepID=A0A068U9F6_COFCA|nr:unnamed protein product [Coffea canephora]
MFLRGRPEVQVQLKYLLVYSLHTCWSFMERRSPQASTFSFAVEGWPYWMIHSQI